MLPLKTPAASLFPSEELAIDRQVRLPAVLRGEKFAPESFEL
jgi:hypothetical protein